MERGRILILGSNKETTYEIRNLFDNQRFELEIALSAEVGKRVLSSRKMNLIMIHSDVLRGHDSEFLELLKNRDYKIPVVVMGDQLETVAAVRNGGELRCFNKPYHPDDVISYIRTL